MGSEKPLKCFKQGSDVITSVSFSRILLAATPKRSEQARPRRVETWQGWLEGKRGGGRCHSEAMFPRHGPTLSFQLRFPRSRHTGCSCPLALLALCPVTSFPASRSQLQVASSRKPPTSPQDPFCHLSPAPCAFPQHMIDIGCANNCVSNQVCSHSLVSL